MRESGAGEDPQPHCPAYGGQYRNSRTSCQDSRSSGDSVQSKITQIMRDVGVPAHIKGYQYMRDAIMMAFKDREIISAVTKRCILSLPRLINNSQQG